MKYTFTVPEKPVSKERPRFGKTWSGKRVVFTKAKTRKFEQRVADEAIAAGVKPQDGPVSVSVVANFTPAKRLHRDTRAAMIAAGWAHDNVRDIDNVSKSILDGLNGIAYADDKQVALLTVYKRWAWVEGVSVTVEALS
jgi:Holliday junction resolvase RusA-like endonuclease